MASEDVTQHVGTRERVSIQRVRPAVLDGRHPAKAIVGMPIEVRADIVCDSHEVLAAVVRFQAGDAGAWTETPMRHVINDVWTAEVVPEELGTHRFTVEAWVDHVATWRRDLMKKIDADTVEPLDMATGAQLLEALVDRVDEPRRQRLESTIATLNDEKIAVTTKVDVAMSSELAAITGDAAPREHKVRFRHLLEVRVDRARAGFSSWYELFPRSTSTEPGTHGTLRTTIDRLKHVAEMGFDVLYLPPIHPIGVSHRKGRNNSVTAGPEDPGSPWAIGGAEGGHKSIHPELGTMEDFHALVAACGDHGLELALDIAFQCTPDHPYVTEHPEWFKHRPDGTIQYAENPPKKYQDIYPFDFETEDAEGLWKELKSVFDFWIEQGVRIFRVDNPHTKSFPFWEWCIGELTREHPECIFLSEAFTRPKVMYELAMRGFTHSYTYFTWRRYKQEIEAYYTELFQTDVADFFRPNSWPNTPDILTDQLQFGGRPMYVQRLVLAATLTANYGMYGPAFELMWSEARPGAEEYLDNEKYEIKTWDADQPHSLAEMIGLVNRIRHAHPALQQDRTLRFHEIDNDQLLAYSKTDASGEDVILVIVNLDAQWQQSGLTWLDLEALGIAEDATFEVRDLFGGGTFTWHGRSNYVELNPHVTPAHIFHVRAHPRTEHDFDPQ